jgi:hypothetical protein
MKINNQHIGGGRLRKTHNQYIEDVQWKPTKMKKVVREDNNIKEKSETIRKEEGHWEKKTLI